MRMFPVLSVWFFWVRTLFAFVPTFMSGNAFRYVVVFLLLCSPCPAMAHPHVFVDAQATVVFDDNGLAGFRVTWVFDDMFSNMIMFDYDTDQNHAFAPGEVEAVRKGAFSNLREFEYFAHIRIGGKSFPVKYVKDFSASIHKHLMTYIFFIPCHVPATGSAKEVRFSMYDSSYYSDITLTKDPVHYEHADAYEVSHGIEHNENDAFYYGQVYPEDIIITFKGNEG